MDVAKESWTPDASMSEGYIGGVSSSIGGVSSSIRGQLGRFLIVGSLTVFIDFVTYRALLWLSVPVIPAKSTSFVVATVVAYVLNRTWTFRARGGIARAAAFAVLYGTTLVVNVSVNALVLDLAGDAGGRIELAFLAAQASSTTINFLAMRYVVFRSEQASAAARGQAGQLVR
jgi:putative flippase GtrA